jgi:capsid protein
MAKRTKLKSAYESAISKIVDGNGRNIPPSKPQAGIHDGTYPTRNKPRFQWVTNQYAQDFNRNVTGADQNLLLSRARELTENSPAIKNAMKEISDWVIGDAWYSKFIGEDQAWGEQAVEWVDNWMGIATFGNNRTFQKSLKIAVVSTLRDGDSIAVLTGTRINDYPQIQWIPSHRIGSYGYDNKIKSGRYKDKTVINGVIYNQYGEVIAYNVIGNSRDGTDDIQIGVKDGMLVYDPEYVDQDRGLTSLAGAINNVDDYNTIKDFELRALKHNSSIAAALHVPAREIDDHAGEYADSPFVTRETQPSGGDRTSTIESLQGGEVMLFRPEDGAKIDFLSSNRPGANTSAFLVDHVLRHAFLSMGVSMELMYDLNSRGATTRLIAAKFQRRIEQIQAEVIYPLWKRCVGYAVAKGIKQGLLPENKEWYKLEPSYPKSFSVEQFKDVKSDLELYSKGVMTGTQMASANGWDYKKNLEEKAKELAYAREIAEKYDINPAELIMQTPNGNPIANPMDPNEDASKSKKDIPEEE